MRNGPNVKYARNPKMLAFFGLMTLGLDICTFKYSRNKRLSNIFENVGQSLFIQILLFQLASTYSFNLPSEVIIIFRNILMPNLAVTNLTK